MNPRCLNCETRAHLHNWDFVLQSLTTEGNVHEYSNARCLIVGALSFVLHGHLDCDRCLRALTKIPLIDNNSLPSNPSKGE